MLTSEREQERVDDDAGGTVSVGGTVGLAPHPGATAAVHCGDADAMRAMAGAVARSASSDPRNAAGAATLAKVLVRQALSRLPGDHVLREAVSETRADVMECVSACVTVLMRARATRDLECIEQVVEAVPVRFVENAEALEAIHTAARAFESSSSDSR